MSSLKMVINHGSKSAALEIEKSNEAQCDVVVRELFRFFNEKAAPIAPQAENSSAVVHKPDPTTPDLQADGNTTSGLRPDKSIKPPLIGSERTLAAPIGEIAKGAASDTASTVPDHYKTGIKYKDGIAHFKMRYWCQNDKCRDKANDYIPADQKIVNCRQCGMALAVVPAAQKGERDSYGNFFVATKPAPGAMG